MIHKKKTREMKSLVQFWIVVEFSRVFPEPMQPCTIFQCILDWVYFKTLAAISSSKNGPIQLGYFFFFSHQEASF